MRHRRGSDQRQALIALHETIWPGGVRLAEPEYRVLIYTCSGFPYSEQCKDIVYLEIIYLNLSAPIYIREKSKPRSHLPKNPWN